MVRIFFSYKSPHIRGKCNYACAPTHACTQGHTYKTHPQITAWLHTQEVGKPTQFDSCLGNNQWDLGVGGLMK